MTQFSTKNPWRHIISHMPPLLEIKLQDFVRAAGMRPDQYPEHCGEKLWISIFLLFFKVSLRNTAEVKQSRAIVMESLEALLFRNMTHFFSFFLAYFKNIEVFLAPNLWAVMNNDLAKLWYECFLNVTVKHAGLRLTPWWNHSLVLRQ